VGAVQYAPGDFPSSKKGDVLTVEFTVLGIPCLGLNGAPEVKHGLAFGGNGQCVHARTLIFLK
jgi:predicted 3-demethylubiquinone-9 3-methyltransferase (glyoxalase superfamily)